MRPFLLSAAVVLLAGCGAAATPTSSATTSAPATETGTPSPPDVAEPTTPPRTASEKRYLKALGASLAKYLGKGENINEDAYIQQGREICGEGDSESGPPTVNLIIEKQELEGEEYKAAIRYLCPKYLPAWRKAQGGFGDGQYTVGKKPRPGTYRTVSRPTTDCYWERSTSGGAIIANAIVTNAPAGVTVTLNRGEGFTSRRCGNWIRVR